MEIQLSGVAIGMQREYNFIPLKQKQKSLEHSTGQGAFYKTDRDNVSDQRASSWV